MKLPRNLRRNRRNRLKAAIAQRLTEQFLLIQIKTHKTSKDTSLTRPQDLGLEHCASA
jgi:hypothetical protein